MNEKGFMTGFFMILIIISGLLFLFWDEVSTFLRDTFTIGETRNEMLLEKIEETP